MNDHHSACVEHTPGSPRGTDTNRYAITLADLVASAQVPVADQVVEQPAAPPHDYSKRLLLGYRDIVQKAAHEDHLPIIVPVAREKIVARENDGEVLSGPRSPF